MKRKSKRRSRNKRRFLLLIIIVLAIFIVTKINKDNKIGDKEVKIDSYVHHITNKTGKTVKDEWQNIILDYLNRYTSSLVYLQPRDVTKLFTDNNSVEAHLTQTTINTQVYHHSKQLIQLKAVQAYYDIEYKSISVKDNKITIKFLEDDYYNFLGLENITSKALDIENVFVLNDNNGNITIDSIRIERDNYVIFTSVLEEKFTYKDIDNLNKKYLDYIDKETKNLKEQVSSSIVYHPKKKCDHEYDRQKAVEYSYKYIDKRNDYYLDYSNLGGNCANFASQSLHEGGIPMDYEGSEQWKYFSDELNEKEVKTGRSSSWVSTYYFYKYAKNNDDSGLCAEVDVNMFYADIGDIIQVGYKDNTYSHTTIVSKIVTEGNSIPRILINSNTTNLEDYPIFGYIYQNKRLIKILGYND